VSTGIEPFTVAIVDDVLGDLAERLRHTRWPDQLAGSAWEYGTDLDYLQDLAGYWAEAFDWRAVEHRINGWPQGVATIDGQAIHFIHARAGSANALPLLVLHGWPGSIIEMLEVIEPSRHGGSEAGSPGDDFHVVCVSLPGFGFSGPTSEPGWHPRRIAAAMVELMGRLGYPRFATLGGDWGATVSNYIGLDFPAHLYGMYLTMGAAGPPEGADGSELRHTEREWVAANAAFFAEESGYLQLQATRPQTLAYGLTDSPTGLAAWIVEKFRAWSDCGGDLESAISRDAILANVTLYWVTGTANSSARIYLEAMRGGQMVTDRFAHQCSHGLRHLPQGDREIAARLGRAGLGRAALDGHATGWPFPLARGPRSPRLRCPGFLPGTTPVRSSPGTDVHRPRFSRWSGRRVSPSP
jgi:pimeloyl-ACP methyl ester carboxylesterase